mgnify:CR=1 FL=1
MKKEETIKNVDEFKIKFTLGNNVYDVSGETIYKALSQIKLEEQTKGIGTFVVEHKGKTSRVPIKIFPAKLNRIFNRQDDLQLFSKRLTFLI